MCHNFLVGACQMKWLIDWGSRLAYRQLVPAAQPDQPPARCLCSRVLTWWMFARICLLGHFRHCLVLGQLCRAQKIVVCPYLTECDSYYIFKRKNIFLCLINLLNECSGVAVTCCHHHGLYLRLATTDMHCDVSRSQPTRFIWWQLTKTSLSTNLFVPVFIFHLCTCYFFCNPWRIWCHVWLIDDINLIF